MSDKVACQYCGKEFTAKGIAMHERACPANPEVATAKVAVTPKENPKTDIRLGYGDVSDKPLKLQLAIAKRRQKDLATHYKNQEKIIVQVSPMYKPYFGNSMAISLNGIPIYVPCDNKKYEIPKSYAMEVNARIRGVDAQINRAARMSDVKANFDGKSLGSLDLIKRV